MPTPDTRTNPGPNPIQNPNRDQRLAYLYNAIANCRYNTREEMWDFNDNAISPAIHDLTELYLGTTALHKAVQKGNATLVKNLIAGTRGNVGTQDSNGVTAYYLALQTQNIDLISPFVDRINNDILPTSPDKVMNTVNEDNYQSGRSQRVTKSILACAVTAQLFRDDILAKLLSHEKINIQNNLPSNSLFNTIETSIKPLVFATQYNLPSIFKVCIQKGEDVNQIINLSNYLNSRDYLLNLAFEINFLKANQNFEIASYLLDQPNINVANKYDDNSLNPIQWATQLNLPSFIEKIRLKQESQLDVLDNAGNSLLHIAVRACALEAVQYLLSKKSKLKYAINNDLQTPLEFQLTFDRNAKQKPIAYDEIKRLLMAKSSAGAWTISAAWFGFDGDKLDWFGVNRRKISDILLDNINAMGGEKFSITPDQLSTETSARKLAIVASRTIDNKAIQVALFFNYMNDGNKYTWEWGSLTNVVNDPNDTRSDSYKALYQNSSPCIQVESAWFGTNGSPRDLIGNDNKTIKSILMKNIARVGNGEGFAIERNNISMYSAGKTLNAVITRKVNGILIKVIVSITPTQDVSFNYTYSWKWGKREFVSLDSSDVNSQLYYEMFPLKPIEVLAAWYGETGAPDEFVSGDRSTPISYWINQNIVNNGGEFMSIMGAQFTINNRGSKLAIALQRNINGTTIKADLFFPAPNDNGKYTWTWGSRNFLKDSPTNDAYKAMYP